MKFVCGICGKAHESVSARARCEAMCLKEREKVLAEEKRRALAEEKSARYQEVATAWNTYVELRNKYVRDYGILFLNDGFPATRLL